METMAGTGIDTAVLTTLGAAFGVMFATLTTLMVSSIRVQHRESTQTRQLITQASERNRELIERECGKNRELIERSTEKNRELIERECGKNRRLIEQESEKSTTDLAEYKRVAERNHNAVVESLNNMASSLGDTRERLARIEGILRIGLSTTTDPESNGGTSEAA
ncbi:MAG: hypothetical protein OXH61_11760 [Acidimicrobiaceae bacterium]|nr:hypothetical protein [Acidimicrobiaceae bacterium]